MKRVLAMTFVVLFGAVVVSARGKQRSDDTLIAYLARVQQSEALRRPVAPGSLWIDGAALTALSADYKARTVGDTVVVQIVEQTTAERSSTVNSQRKFDASSGLLALAGRINTGGVAAMFSPTSNVKLQGQGQAASKSAIRTSVAGRIVAVLPNGNLVLEARRDSTANNERQTVLLRGVARPGDVSPDNAVLSTQLSDLEIELKGRGVISDATRPPNWVVRAVLKVLGF